MLQGEGRVLGMQDKVVEGRPLGFQPVTPPHPVPEVGAGAPPLVPLLEVANAEIGDLQDQLAETETDRDAHHDAADALWVHLRDVVAHVRTIQPPDSVLPEDVEAAVHGLVEYQSYAPVEGDEQ